MRAREDDSGGRAYATVTMLEAGTKENVVPERATITVARRFLPNESVQDIDAEIDDLLAGIAADRGIEMSWERTQTYESAAVDGLNALRDAAREVLAGDLA